MTFGLISQAKAALARIRKWVVWWRWFFSYDRPQDCDRESKRIAFQRWLDREPK